MKPDRKDHRENEVNQGRQVNRDHLGKGAILAHLGLKDNQDLLDQQVRVVLEVSRDHEVNRDQEGKQAHQVSLDHRDSGESLDLKDLQDHKGRQEVVVNLDHRELLDKEENKAHAVNLVSVPSQL